jgi:hypothetical protein
MLQYNNRTQVSTLSWNLIFQLTAVPLLPVAANPPEPCEPVRPEVEDVRDTMYFLVRIPVCI